MRITICFLIFYFFLPLVSISILRFLYKTWWSRHKFFFFGKRDKWGKCGRIGYTGPTGRTGPRHDPSDPTVYCTHTSLAQLLASSSLLVEVILASSLEPVTKNTFFLSTYFPIRTTESIEIADSLKAETGWASVSLRCLYMHREVNICSCNEVSTNEVTSFHY